MLKVDREIRDRISAEVKHFMNVSVTFGEGRNKSRVADLLIDGTKPHRVFYSPGDGNQRIIPNIVAQVRRAIKEQGGIERPRKKHPPARPHRSQTNGHHRPEYPPPDQSRVGSLGELMMAAAQRDQLNPLCPDDAAEIMRHEKSRNGHAPVSGSSKNGHHNNGSAPVAHATQPLPRAVIALPARPVAVPAMAQPAAPSAPAPAMEAADHGPTPDTPEKKKIQLGHEHVVHLTQLLMINGKKIDGEPPRYTYNDGWTDEKVRDLVHAGVKVERIIEFRRQHFGLTTEELDNVRMKSDQKGFLGRVASLENALRDALARIAELEKIVAPLKD